MASVPWWKPTESTRVLLIEGMTFAPFLLLIHLLLWFTASYWTLAGVLAIIVASWAVSLAAKGLGLLNRSHWITVALCTWVPVSIVYALIAPNGRAVFLMFCVFLSASLASGALRYLFVRCGWLPK